MELSKNIEIGDKLEIKMEKNEKSNTYLSLVEDILNEKTLLLHAPISLGKLVKLPRDSIYSLTIFTEQGKTMIRFNAKILKYLKSNGFHLMKTVLISDGERVQRREYFRFNCFLPMKYIEVSDDYDEEPPTDYVFKEGIIKDIAGGGIRFVSNSDIVEKTLIKCAIMLNEDFLIVIGKVLRKEEGKDSKFKYQYRVEFLGMQPEERELIIRYIFNEQRKMLKFTR